MLREIRLDLGGPTTTWHGEVAVRGGGGVVITLPPPQAGCRAAVARATARVVTDAGTVTARLADPYEVIPGLAAEQCTVQDLERLADIRGTGIEVRGTGTTSTADLVITARPTGEQGTVRIDQAAPTVLLRSTSGGAWTIDALVRSPGPDTVVRLALEPARCDAHSIAEDKVGTVLRVQVSGDVTGTFRLPLAPGVKQATLDWVAERCGLGEG